MSNKRTFRYKTWLFRIAVLLLAAYAVCIEPNWLEVNVTTLNTHTTAERVRVMLLSDLHLHEMGSREAEVVRQVQQLKPDLIVLSGDVTDRADALPVLDALLSQLGDIPKVAILGNWEYWADLDLPALRQLYEQKHQTKLLVNQTSSYQIRSRTIHVLGIDDFTAGSPDIRAAKFDRQDGSLIVVQHSPGWFEQPDLGQLGRKADVCLAGHTHGGQVTLFGRVLWKPQGSGHFDAGFYSTQHCPLYISRGVGTSIFPIRFWARPEILVVDL